jgi:hypothetical protein
MYTAYNIGQRALGYVSKIAESVNMPRILASVERNAMMTGEATYFNQW